MGQSSIEWLHSEYKRILGDVMVTPTQGIEIAEALGKAKEMHKQEVIDDYARGYIDGVAKNKITAEQYYNETYNIKS